MPPEARDEAVELPLVQAALEAVAEQRAELLPLAHAVEQRLGHAHARRREVDRELARAGLAHVREVAAAEHGRGGGLRQRRRVQEAARLARREVLARLARAARATVARGEAFRSCTQPNAPSTSARGALRAQLAEAARRERGDPRVEPVGEEVDAAAELPLERVHRQRLEVAAGSRAARRAPRPRAPAPCRACGCSRRGRSSAARGSASASSPAPCRRGCRRAPARGSARRSSPLRTRIRRATLPYASSTEWRRRR